MKPLAPWFGNMLTAGIGMSLADSCVLRVAFALAFGLSLVIVILRFAHNWNEV
jgi:hypothetical protein